MSLDFRAEPFAHGHAASLEILSSKEDFGRPRLGAVLPTHGDQSVKVESMSVEEVQHLITVLTDLLPRMQQPPKPTGKYQF